MRVDIIMKVIGLLIVVMLVPEPTMGQVRNLLYCVNGIVTFDEHQCIFRSGEVQLRGTPLNVGEEGEFEVVQGFATLETGERVTVDDGMVRVRVLPYGNRAIKRALHRAGITLAEFIERAETYPPQKGVVVVTDGVISISGNYFDIHAGVLIVVKVHEDTRPDSTGIYGTGETVTETAIPVTSTYTQLVTLSKTSTRDALVTITSPVYTYAEATSTNILRHTVPVNDEQVIRTTLPGRLIVETLPVESELVMTVTDTPINYVIQTEPKTVTTTLLHYAQNFNFRTITINVVSTVNFVQTIPQTYIVTEYTTNTLGSTIYSTRTTTVTVTSEPVPKPYIF